MVLKISKRLLTVAALVPSCNTLADIGSDHGLLPLYLLRENKIRYACCCDIRPGPLEAAAKNIEAFGMNDRAVPMLGSGLSPVRDIPHECAVIAGMGGETIAQILRDGEIDAKDPRLFVLQPMSRAHLLREYLADSGFETVDFALCEDAGRLYECLSVRKGAHVEADPLYLYINRRYSADGQLYERYVSQYLRRLAAMLDGMEQSVQPDYAATKPLRSLLAQLDALADTIRTRNPAVARPENSCSSA